ncbi:hypothetical protein J3T65_09865 [Staphylococcus simiae]|uniref:hypothetical protein n=1 Tax=Staphylococcus simiae TaxID=308354 RepID=UPI001A9A1B43|nr:hypothetical protein [Staphylococcus simiae]MBO1198290.1 hypothetical protein [Staphylococcus simiae]MBO1201975.1 hypothetical protein [Staphylococcus simiae]MBO1204193.1 hypothetical protein [Staphylococcus simiae]MBO1210282.1 hypothetical protein [Staphylococcus simiae]MBO1230427.1 hypothetical protein [Staphylococcus simiae]
MKKFLAISSVLLLFGILIVTVAFAYINYKSLEIQKEEVKLEEKKYKMQVENNTSKSEEENQNINQTSQSSTSDVEQESTTNGKSSNDEVINEKAKQFEKGYDVNSDEAQVLANEFTKADKDGDGIVTTKEMTPTLQQFAKEGKFQPSAGGVK